MLKVISPTGCVHIVDNAYSDKLVGRVTLCNHVNYHGEHGEQFRHHWTLTTSKVTCRRCLASLKRITDKLETSWTSVNTNCQHRFPHPELGIMCIEPHRTSYDRLHSPNSYKKCLKRYCPIKQHPLVVDPGPLMDMIGYILAELGTEIIATDRKFKTRFSMVSGHCGYRKKTNPRRHEKTRWRCTSPRLADKEFGWACNIGNCPYLNRALDWRANNNM